MKGVVAIALKELVVNEFGEDKWHEALGNAGVDKEPVILPFSEVDDALVVEVVRGVCKALDISMEQAADAFGEYWVGVYSQKLYRHYYSSCATAKEFLLKMDEVHVSATKFVPGARPPRFEYKWENDKTLVMTYKSHRGLMDIMIGLVEGVGRFYKEELQVDKIGNEQARIVFA